MCGRIPVHQTERGTKMTNNLPENDDAPWLNLTPEEINQLRNQKYQLTKYGREKIRTLIKLAQEHSTDAP